MFVKFNDGFVVFYALKDPQTGLHINETNVKLFRHRYEADEYKTLSSAFKDFQVVELIFRLDHEVPV